MPGVELNAKGWFTYDYMFHRPAGQVSSDFRVVPLAERDVDERILRRLERQVPVVWTSIRESLGDVAHDDKPSDMERRIGRIEELVAEDIGSRRGIAPLAKVSAGGLFGAAKSIADHPSPNIAIITGFYLPYAEPPGCETDGPPGAAHLALAFHNAGIPCRVATDMVDERVVLASLWGAGLPGDFPVDTVSMDEHGKDGGKPLEQVIKAWRDASPPITHVIAVERGGPATDGKPHNFSGDDTSAFNAPLHRLYTAGDWTTIGIGDGGNEIGMGNLPFDLVATNVKNGDKVACTVKCDHLIVCGTSNWGGWALPMSLALLRPDLRESLTAGLNRETDYRILKVAVEKGRATALESFDSKRAHPTMSVDALPWDIHGQKLDQLLDVLDSLDRTSRN